MSLKSVADIFYIIHKSMDLQQKAKDRPVTNSYYPSTLSTFERANTFYYLWNGK